MFFILMGRQAMLVSQEPLGGAQGDLMVETDICPKCQWEVGESVECPRCGVIVAKAAGAARALDTVEVVKTSSSSGRLSTLILLLVFGGVAILAFGNAQGQEEDEAGSELAVTTSKPLPAAPRAAEYVTVSDEGLEDFVSPEWFEGAAGLDRGLQLAKEEDRPVLLYFYTDWCGYCRQLEGNLLETATVEDYTEHIIKVRINPEKGSAERQLAKTYGVRGFPSLFMHSTATARAASISRMSGRKLQRPADFVETLRVASKR